MEYLREPKFWVSVVVVTVAVGFVGSIALRYFGNRPCDNC